MRVWDDIQPERLCRQHLLGEHNEIHGMWTILSKLQAGEKAGYANHPEVARWKGAEERLHERHEALVREMLDRGYNHRSPLDRGRLEVGDGPASSPHDDQEAALLAKGCDCRTVETVGKINVEE